MLPRAVPLLLLVACCAASPAAAKVDPQSTAANALARFVNDTRGLTSKDASSSTRRSLLTTADRIQLVAFRRPCSAVGLIRGYRSRLVMYSEPAGNPGTPRFAASSIRPCALRPPPPSHSPQTAHAA